MEDNLLVQLFNELKAIDLSKRGDENISALKPGEEIIGELDDDLKKFYFLVMDAKRALDRETKRIAMKYANVNPIELVELRPEDRSSFEAISTKAKAVDWLFWGSVCGRHKVRGERVGIRKGFVVVSCGSPNDSPHVLIVVEGVILEGEIGPGEIDPFRWN